MRTSTPGMRNESPPTPLKELEVLYMYTIVTVEDWTTMKIRALLILTLLSLVCCEASLELLLSSYQNPSHQLYTGRCCDSLSTTLCHLDPCDNALTLCLLPRLIHTTTGPYIKERSFERLVCPEGWSTVDLGLVSMDSDNVSFPGERRWINQRKRLGNPLTLSGEQWKDGFKLLVLVADFDRDVRELVNVLAADWDPLVTSNKFPPPRIVRGVGRGDVTLALSARVRNVKHTKKPLIVATPEPPTILKSSSDDSSPLSSPLTLTPTTQLSTTVQATSQETMTLSMQGVTTQAMQGVATQAMQGVATQAMQGVTVLGAAQSKENVRGVVKSSGSVMSGGTVGAVVGGVLGTVSVIVLSLLVVVMCLNCLKKKRRDEQVMLTGNTDSEVAALRTGPMDNPNYTVSPNTNSQSGHGFNNSLYGALSQGGLSHDNHMTPSPPPQEPIHSQYSQISREHMENNSLVDSGSYSQVTEPPLPAGYSVVSREHIEEEEYSVVTRENMTDGYSVVTREHLEEASDSEEEESHDFSTSKLLTGH